MAEIQMDQTMNYSSRNGISYTKLRQAFEGMDIGFLKVQEKLRVYTSELDRGKMELKAIKDVNRNLKLSIEENKEEINKIASRMSSIRTKLEVSIVSANASKAEMEEHKVKHDEFQVEVARLEERLSAITAEIDRMRDPANPESNMSMKRHVTNDRKEIKRLRAEIASVKGHNSKLLLEEKEKALEVEGLMEKVKFCQERLKSLEEELDNAIKDTESEKELKMELYSKYSELRTESLGYADKVKALKIRLGMVEAGRSVSEKVVSEIKTRDSKLQKEGVYLEKKLKEASYELENLKSKDNQTKTFNSIQGHTFRMQGKVKAIDLTGRLGNLGKIAEAKRNKSKYVSSKSTDGDLTTRSKVSDPVTARSSFSDVGVKVSGKGSVTGKGTSRSSVAGPTVKFQGGDSTGTTNRSQSVRTNAPKDSPRRQSVAFVPQKKIT